MALHRTLAVPPARQQPAAAGSSLPLPPLTPWPFVLSSPSRGPAMPLSFIFETALGFVAISWGERGLTRLVLPQTTRAAAGRGLRSEEHTSELQSRENLVCRLLL